MGRVVVVGSLNVDHVTRVHRLPRPGETLLGEAAGRLAGGKGANQAVAAREAGAEVRLLGRVGDDEDGNAYLARLSAKGIDCSGVTRSPSRPTGRALITVDEAGQNTIVVVPGANDELREEHLGPVDAVHAGDVVLLQLEIARRVVEAAARRARRAGARVVINLAPYAALAPDVVALADPVVVNEHEARLLADSGLLPEELLVTFGAAGARWDAMQVDGVAVPPDRVLDTTGAGDAFCGALAAALADGSDRATALTAAARAGAAAVTHHGAQADAAL